jgi:hypothetical protein
MKSHTRVAVAYIAGRLILNKEAGTIYDHEFSRYVLMSGVVSPTEVETLDVERQAQVHGTAEEGTLSLRDNEDQSRISLRIDGSKFCGYDYGSSTQFSGTVDQGYISLIDHNNGEHFHYSL